VSKRVAAELKEQMRKALSEPRPVRIHHSPTVYVYEPIESLVVEASRLPAEEMETVVVAATRLPIETVTVAASRLPAESIELADSRTAQVRL
jgi:hypothetical protein